MKKSLKFKKRFCNVGFTLVELVIVIAIVIILSVISVPIYRGYVDKSKMAEGYALLSSVLSAQKAYYSEYGNFLRMENSNGYSGYNYCTSYDTILGIDARGNKYFSYFNIGYCGSNGEKVRYYFYSGVRVPQDMIKDGNLWLLLQYNTTLGARILEWNGDGGRISDWA